MIVLDTNVVSALMRRNPDPGVIAWLDRQERDRIWTTAISVFEIRYGLALLPAGGKRRDLEAAFARALAEEFEGRVLSFNAEAAEAAATIAAARRGRRRPADFRDTQIGGIVLSRRATLATRNRRYFTDLDIALVDPWAE
ncbi:MAG: type II toxin-antitoxin system VapC family toxin [Alphaproteobacteria bacterium]|nr:type II toxin-antitoxin system VapC family toxin [Alphaproteobacteria bacterium]